MHIKIVDGYLGDVVDFGELEGDAEAGEERGDERASVRERGEFEFEIGGLRIHGVGQVFEGLRYLSQRLLIVEIRH